MENKENIRLLVFFLLGDSAASEFWNTVSSTSIGGLSFPLTPTMKMEETQCSETSAYKIQAPANHPKERIQLLGHGEGFKSRILDLY